MNKFVILGGGTAGWITALFVRRTFPHSHITLIESKEIGIVGVGEATTPHLVDFLKDQDINIFELLKKTKGTIKNGINFVNWNGDQKQYFHDFFERLTNFEIPNVYSTGCEDYFKKKVINNNLSLNDYIYQQKLAYSNKVDLKNTNYALHFDSALFAEYLENIGRNRNINVLDDILQDTTLDENGFIKSLKLQSGKTVDCTFVFDCTGFSRLLIGKLYKSKWKSYSDFLPAKKAIPFWLEKQKIIKPYTDSIALKNGWMWNIPLQHRTGAGYVFDSDYITVDQAKQEVEEYLGQEIEVRKIINFDPGRFEQVWIKNCLAVGLSSNFLEPLESTSLWLVRSQLFNFKQFINEINNPDPYSQELYNTIAREEADEKAHLIYFHYLTKRKDSDFWREFRIKNPVPEKFAHTLSLVKKGNIRFFNFHDTLRPSIFPMQSYLMIGHGLGIFESKFNLENFDHVKPSLEEYKDLITRACNNAIPHEEFLLHL